MTNKELYKMLYSAKDTFIELKEAEDMVRNMKLLATSTGAIRYDKPNVQTSPRNDGLIISIERIVEAEEKLKRISEKYKNNREIVLKILTFLDDQVDADIYRYTWIRFIDTKTIAYNLNMTPESVRKRKERIANYLLSQYLEELVDLSHHML